MNRHTMWEIVLECLEKMYDTDGLYEIVKIINYIHDEIFKLTKEDSDNKATIENVVEQIFNKYHRIYILEQDIHLLKKFIIEALYNYPKQLRDWIDYIYAEVFKDEYDEDDLI